MGSGYLQLLLLLEIFEPFFVWGDRCQVLLWIYKVLRGVWRFLVRFSWWVL